MSESVGGTTVIEARVVHKKSNALKMTFTDGPGEPFAVGVQGVGDSRGKKLGTLFGFNNGGTGNHQITYRDGGVLNVASKDGAPSVFTRADGAEVATIHRGDSSSAVLAGGTELFRFVSHPTEAESYELFRTIVTTPAGEQVANLDIVRQVRGWTLARVVDEAWDEYVWWGQAGPPLPVPILGARLHLDRPIDGVERDVLIGACVDIAIGLRPYITEMK